MSGPAEQLLEVQDLKIVIGATGSRVTAVDGASFELSAGESLGIAGESGSGKTLTALALARLFPAGVPVAASGRVCLTDRSGETLELLTAPSDRLVRIRGREVGMIFQEPASCLNPVLRIGFQISEGLMRHRGHSRKEARDQALKLLERVRIPDPWRVFRAYPHELSGGMQQRAMLAMALAPEPRLLVADEPTTALDLTVQARILELLLELQAERGMALILISHDLGVLRSVTDRVLVMHEGKVIDQQSTASLFADSPAADLHPQTRKLLQRRLRLLAGEGREPRETPDEPILEVRGLTKTYRSPGLSLRRGAPVHAVQSVSFKIARGTTLGLVGESGAGKSTLMRCLLRIEKPTSGAISFQGNDWLAPRGARLRRRRSAFQAVFQNPQRSLDPLLTVGDSVGEGLRARGRFGPGAWATQVAKLLETVGLDPAMGQRYPHELSGGERQRITIARALALKPALIVLDEAVSSLDVAVRGEILDLLLAIQERSGLSYLFISHDLAVVERMSDTIGVMHRGRLVELDEAARVLGSPQHPHTCELLAAAQRCW